MWPHLTEYRQIIQTLLEPKEILDSVDEVDFSDLYQRGFRTIILDVDNTILRYDERQLTLQKINMIGQIKRLGFRIFLVSNNSGHRRLERVANQVNLTGLYFSLKPFVFGLRDLGREQRLDFQSTVMIGDQLFTDIIAGNWLRAYTILVDPLDKKASFIKTVQKELELYLLRKIENH